MADPHVLQLLAGAEAGSEDASAELFDMYAKHVLRAVRAHRSSGSDDAVGDRTVSEGGSSLACIHDHARVGSGTLKCGIRLLAAATSIRTINSRMLW